MFTPIQRHFTDECHGCLFWENNECARTRECTTFQDHFDNDYTSAYDFVPYKWVLHHWYMYDFGPECLLVEQNAEIFDACPNNEEDFQYLLETYPQIIGILVPKSE